MVKEGYTKETSFSIENMTGYFLDDFVGVVKFKDGCFGFTVIGEASTGYFVPFSKFDELHEDFPGITSK